MFQKYQKLSGISQRHNVAKTAERPGVTQMAERSKRINLALCQVISAMFVPRCPGRLNACANVTALAQHLTHGGGGGVGGLREMRSV